jgi:uncharacterized protein YndB with AHSA1/START domain
MTNSNLRVSRVIRAPREAIYRVFLNGTALAAWLPPEGMTARVHAFDGREGGLYRMSLIHAEPGHPPGKTTADTDTFDGRFVKLVPNTLIVQESTFDSNDPGFSGTMTIEWALADAADGTEVTVRVRNVPPGISAQDHEAGILSSLENLAAFVE